MRTKRRFFIAIKRHSAMRLSISAFLVISSLLLAGCKTSLGQPTEAVHFRPPFIPVTFSLDSNGHFSVSVGFSITTPIGAFSASSEVGTPIPNNSTRVSIIHTVNGTPVKDVYDIAERGSINVCLDGRFWENVGENSISITPLDGISTISIVQARSQCATAASPPAPSVRSPSPDVATAASPPMLPSNIRISCKWHRSDQDLSPFTSCSQSIQTGDSFGLVRLTFSGLDLAHWYFLQQPGNGSWQGEVQVGSTTTGTIYETNENNLHQDSNGQLAGDDLRASLYYDIIIDPSDLPQTVYARLYSGDYANLSRTFAVQLH
jgi:hypothetical protein